MRNLIIFKAKTPRTYSNRMGVGRFLLPIWLVGSKTAVTNKKEKQEETRWIKLP
ncbi:MAG: hypothetical protein IAF02_13195 [Anaerolineae bacterium]|nr:hypothetical protein [Anaerolineae bacterium]